MTDEGYGSRYQIYNSQTRSNYYVPSYNHSPVYHNAQQYLQSNNLSMSQQRDCQAQWIGNYYPMYHNGQLRSNNFSTGQQREFQPQCIGNYSPMYHNGQLQSNNSSMSQQRDCQAQWIGNYYPMYQNGQLQSNNLSTSQQREFQPQCIGNHSPMYHNGQLQSNNSCQQRDFQMQWIGNYYPMYHNRQLQRNNSSMSQQRDCHVPSHNSVPVFQNGQPCMPTNHSSVKLNDVNSNDRMNGFDVDVRKDDPVNELDINSTTEVDQIDEIYVDVINDQASEAEGVNLHSDDLINEIDSNLSTEGDQIDEIYVDVINDQASEAEGVNLHSDDLINEIDSNLSTEGDQIDEIYVDVINDQVSEAPEGVNLHSEDLINEINFNLTTGCQIDEPNVDVISDPVFELEIDNQQVYAESLSIKPKHTRGCDKSVMFVKSSDQSTKKLCCPFCDKLYTKLAKHMETKHKHEKDVQRFLSFPKGSKQRRAIQDSLRKIGTLNWNMDASKNKGLLITSRRPNAKLRRTAGYYKTCPYCYGQHSKAALRLHIRYTCPNKPIDITKKAKGERKLTLALGTLVEARYHENVSAALENVLTHLRDSQGDSDVVRLIKFDWLIVLYGNKLCKKYTRAKRIDMLQNRLRLAGRILHELQRIQPEVSDFATLYKPKYYDNVIEAIQAVARFDTTCNEYGAPGTATSSVTAIKKIGTILRAEFIKRDDQENQRITENFLILMESDIHDAINKAANETQNKRKRQNPVQLPSADDVKLLAQYIETESIKSMNELSETFDDKVWLRLSHLTLASIIVFNRKRVGDAEDIAVDEFHHREVMNESKNELLFASLSEESKETAKQYSRMNVRGKKGYNVPVLLKQNMEKQIDLLLLHREEAGVPPKNEFVFALPSSTGEIRVIKACNVLSKFARACGAINPSRLTSTNLRKQLATFCVSLELNDTEVADVAAFMGHAEKVHRQFYRQNTIDRQIVKMSKVLEAAQGSVTHDPPDQVPKDRVRAVRKRKAPSSTSLEISPDNSAINNRSTTVKEQALEPALSNRTPIITDQVPKDRVRAVRKRKAPSSTSLEISPDNSAINNRSRTVKKQALEPALGNGTHTAADQVPKDRVRAVRKRKTPSSTLETIQSNSTINSRSTKSTTVGKEVLEPALGSGTHIAADQVPKDGHRVRAVRQRKIPSSTLQVLEIGQRKMAITSRLATVRKRKSTT